MMGQMYGDKDAEVKTDVVKWVSLRWVRLVNPLRARKRPSNAPGTISKTILNDQINIFDVKQGLLRLRSGVEGPGQSI